MDDRDIKKLTKYDKFGRVLLMLLLIGGWVWLNVAADREPASLIGNTVSVWAIILSCGWGKMSKSWKRALLELVRND